MQRKGNELGLPQFVDEIDATVKTADFSKVDNAIDKIIRFKGTKTPEGEILPNDRILNAINRALQDNNIDPITIADLKDGTKFTKNQMDRIINYFEVGSEKPKLYLQTGKGSGERNKDLRRMYQSSLSIYNQSKKYFEQIAKKVGVEPSPAAADAVDEFQPLTVLEIRDMRSLALDLGRTLMAQGKNNDARIAYGFAESLLRDLESAPEGVNVAFDTARAYSKSLNDVYSRAFAGNILAKQKTGAQRKAPELLHKDLFIGGADPTFLRVQQIHEIGNFAKNQGLEGAEDTIATVSGTLDQIIRNARASVFDETTGRIDPKKLQAWSRQNKDLLEAFPALKVDLEDAEKANILLNQFIKKESNIQKSIKNQITYRDISGVENPTLALLRAINSKFPTKALNSLVRAAKNNEQALAGLKTSMLETAMQKAGGSSETFSPRALFDALFTKLPNAIDNRTTLMSYMQKNKVIKESEVNNLKKLITEMVKLEAAESLGQIDDVIEKTGTIMDLYLRITGSAIGTKLQGAMFGGQGPGSLVAASAGSKAVRTLFNSIPESLKTDVMTEVMQNPSLLATLLRKTTNEQQKLNIASKLKNILTKAGFIAVTKPVRETFRVTPSLIREAEEEEIDYTDPSFEGIEKQSSVQPNVAGSPTTQITARPPSGVNNRIAANVGLSPPAAPNVNQRAQLASLFPGDITSGLIKAQQPTQFMQDGGAAFEMGLETAPVEVQQSIMSGLQGGDDNEFYYATPKMPSNISYSTNNRQSGISTIANPFLQNLKDSFKIGDFQIVPKVGPNKFGVTFKKSFANGGIVGLANGGDPFDMSFSDFAPATGQYDERPMDYTKDDYDDYVKEEAARIAAPKVGISRSNIIGSDTYDPRFAQALNIKDNRLPGNTAQSILNIIGARDFNKRFAQGIPSLSRPTDLIPQYDGGKYFSFGEKSLMEPKGLLQFLLPGGFLKPLMESNILSQLKNRFINTTPPVNRDGQYFKTAISVEPTRSVYDPTQLPVTQIPTDAMLIERQMAGQPILQDMYRDASGNITLDTYAAGLPEAFGNRIQYERAPIRMLESKTPNIFSGKVRDYGTGQFDFKSQDDIRFEQQNRKYRA